MRSLIGITIGAAIGGVVGASGLLCPSGTCAITGSWYGGAITGGLFGLIFAMPRRAAALRDDQEVRMNSDSATTPPGATKDEPK